MKTFVIYGINTVAGANIACALGDRAHVVGIASANAPELTGIQILEEEGAEPVRLLADRNPDYVIDASCCGDSPWNPQAELAAEDQCAASLKRADACAELNLPFALLSSDAVLTGPWMFHEEDSSNHCSSVLGQRLLKLESRILETCARSLVVRTHPFGWSPASGQETPGWIEHLLERARAGKPCSELCQPGNATPLLASELAVILERACAEQLTGLYHVAGAERVNRLQFARRLTAFLGINQFRTPLLEGHFSQAERKNFACGEMSLQTRKVRRALCLAMPTLSESLEQLDRQRVNGFLDKLATGNRRGQFSRAA
ncbi:MAG: sugar nucleotide-binding protein [Planctomycetaceae bacterium]|nr:sugar nucleotide-binding protein [Planctomycetaceae bacterium]